MVAALWTLQLVWTKWMNLLRWNSQQQPSSSLHLQVRKIYHVVSCKRKYLVAGVTRSWRVAFQGFSMLMNIAFFHTSPFTIPPTRIQLLAQYCSPTRFNHTLLYRCGLSIARRALLVLFPFNILFLRKLNQKTPAPYLYLQISLSFLALRRATQMNCR